MSGDEDRRSKEQADEKGSPVCMRPEALGTRVHLVLALLARADLGHAVREDGR